MLLSRAGEAGGLPVICQGALQAGKPRPLPLVMGLLPCPGAARAAAQFISSPSQAWQLKAVTVIELTLPWP